VLRRILFLSLLLTFIHPLSASATTYGCPEGNTCVFSNSKLRFGNGSENSINSVGLFQQPFYKSGSNWRQLTFSNYPLDMAIGTGTGGANWTGNAAPTDLSSTGGMTSRVIDYSLFQQTGVSGSVITGIGTISVVGRFTINSRLFEVKHIYELGLNDAFVKITTNVKNISGSAASNLNIWVGTRDDYVGGSDRPKKTRGNLTGTGGAFAKLSSASDYAKALRITTDTEGVLFYTTSENSDMAYNSCCSFSSAFNQNPATSPGGGGNVTDYIESGFYDGSYAAVLRAGDIANDSTATITWFYAAGAIGDLTAVSQAVAAAAAPSVPTGVPGNTEIALSWTAPSSADPIVGYRIYKSTDGSTFDAGTDNVSTELSKTITGLTNGTNYYFKVAALTGTSPYTVGSPSAASAAITPRTIPGVPTSVTPTRQNSQISLSWTAPASNGGSAITDYLIEYSSDAGANWTTFVDSISATPSTVVTGLTNGTSYIFRVSAKNVAGTGLPSADSSVAIPVAPFALTLALSANSINAGETLTATITAQISEGVTYPDYGGPAPTITAPTDSAATFATPSTWSAGVSTVVVTLRTAGNQSLTVTSGLVSATAGPVAVAVGALNKFSITIASSLNQNQVATATIAAQDFYANTVTTYTPVNPVLSSSGNEATFGTLSAWVNGVATVSVSYANNGSRNFIYTDGAISKTVIVTVTVPTIPVVSVVSPSTSTTDGGIAVTITGSQLIGTSSVTIGGIAATNVTVVSDTEITFTNPANAEGEQIIVVTTGSGVDVDAKVFTYTPNAATIASRAAQAAAAAARAEAARQAAANQALAQTITVQAAPSTTPNTTSGPITLGGITASSSIFVAPESRPLIPGFESLRVSGNTFEIIPTQTFSGKMNVPVTVVQNGATVTLNIPVIVNPKPVPTAATTPTSRTATNVTWEVSPNAASYKVVLNNVSLCETASASCSIPKILGPKAKLEVISLGNDGTVSTQVLPAYVPGKPIPVLDVKFSSGSSRIDSKGIRQLKQFVQLMEEQGFTRVTVTAFTDSIGSQSNAKILSSARSKAIAAYLDRFLSVSIRPSGAGVAPNAKNGKADSNARKAQIAVQ
jgi:hypothetical protein